MITGNIKESEKYYVLNPYFKEAFEVLKTLTPDMCENYKSENITVKVSDNITSDLSQDGAPRVFEAHRKFIDVHFVIDGTEAIGYANIRDLKAKTEYNPDRDCQFYEGEANKIRLDRGDFCITFPEDAHIPFMNPGKESKVKRCVVKIEI